MGVYRRAEGYRVRSSSRRAAFFPDVGSACFSQTDTSWIPSILPWVDDHHAGLAEELFGRHFPVTVGPQVVHRADLACHEAMVQAAVRDVELMLERRFFQERLSFRPRRWPNLCRSPMSRDLAALALAKELWPERLVRQEHLANEWFRLVGVQRRLWAQPPRANAVLRGLLDQSSDAAS